MHCRQCDYLLFNLEHPQCPECGRRFSIEEYRFERGSVSFHCPHCDQAYYGNDERGLPVPRSFTCVKCGNDISLDELRVVPERPDAMGFIGSAWDERHERGLWSAWWMTVKQLLLQPSAFYRNHAGTSIREAWLFAMLASYVGMVPTMGYEILLLWGMSSGPLVTGQGAPLLPTNVMPMMVIMCVITALVGPLFIPFLAGGIQALTTHLGLLVLVPHRKSLETTFRTVLYSFGAYPVYAVPLCGAWAGGIWQRVIVIVGIKEVHQTTGWRAAIAVLWPIAALMLVYAVVIVMLIGWAFASG